MAPQEETERRVDYGYMRAQFEHITAILCKLEPLPELVTGMKQTIAEMVRKVEGHDITLYGEKAETGIVGRLERVEVKINQIFAGIGLVGSALILWFIAQVTGLIHP
jgi:hypothetical protein